MPNVPISSLPSVTSIGPTDVLLLEQGGVTSKGTVSQLLANTTSSSVSSLGTITDVHLTNLTNGQVLTYSASTSSWINATSVSTSTVPITSINPTQGQVLTYSSSASAFVNASSSGAISYSAQVLADAPALYYQFRESSGTSATDSSGNARNGTITGPVSFQAATLASDRADYSLLFYSNQTVAYITAPAELLTTSAWTFEAIIQPLFSPGANNYFRLFSTSGFGATSGVSFGASISPATVGALFYSIATTGGNASASGTQIPFAVPNAGQKIHLALVYNGTSLIIYYNGSAIPLVTTGISGTTITAGNNLRIGQDVASVTIPNQFNGFMDEVAVYQIALSPARIRAHVNAMYSGQTI